MVRIGLTLWVGVAMASFEDLAFDWGTLCQECPECWTPSGECPSRVLVYDGQLEWRNVARMFVDHKFKILRPTVFLSTRVLTHSAYADASTPLTKQISALYLFDQPLNVLATTVLIYITCDLVPPCVYTESHMHCLPTLSTDYNSLIKKKYFQ